MTTSTPDLSRLRIERPAAVPRRRRSGRWVVAVLLLAAVAVAAWQYGAFDLRPVVTTAKVLRLSGTAAVSGTSANGYVVARRRAALSTDIQGRIVELNVEEGDRVKQGDVIARLDTSELEATLVRLQREVENARASAEWAQLDYERKLPLLADGLVSQADVDLARSQQDQAASALQAAEAGVREVQVQISKSAVYAPFDGVITQKNAEVGEVVASFSAGSNTRGSVATLVDFDTLEVQVELAQTSLKAAREGAPVQITLDAWPDRAYKGRVRQIWPQADRQKATVELRVEFVERDDRILPEMGCRVVFLDAEAARDAAPRGPELRVSARAVQLGSGQAGHVFTVQDGRVARREVVLAGEAGPGLLKVAGGLEGGETVVVDPPESLQDGDGVRVEDGG